MWLTLPPMKNYWHEPTCQQYNREWCAEEKGHSWGPRHYVEEQLSSLALWLGCSNSVYATRCLTHMYRTYIYFFVIAQCDTSQQTSANKTKHATEKIFLHLHWKMAHYSGREWQTTLHVTAERESGEGLHHTCLTAPASAYPSCHALLYLNPQNPSRFSN